VAKYSNKWEDDVQAKYLYYQWIVVALLFGSSIGCFAQQKRISMQERGEILQLLASRNHVDVQGMPPWYIDVQKACDKIKSLGPSVADIYFEVLGNKNGTYEHAVPVVLRRIHEIESSDVKEFIVKYRQKVKEGEIEWIYATYALCKMQVDVKVNVAYLVKLASNVVAAPRDWAAEHIVSVLIGLGEDIAAESVMRVVGLDLSLDWTMFSLTGEWRNKGKEVFREVFKARVVALLMLRRCLMEIGADKGKRDKVISARNDELELICALMTRATRRSMILSEDVDDFVLVIDEILQTYERLSFISIMKEMLKTKVKEGHTGLIGGIDVSFTNEEYKKYIKENVLVKWR
jgi:hypothetical protein